MASRRRGRVDVGLAHAVMPDERTQANDNSLRDPHFLRSAAERPASECAGCHIANAAKTDMTYIQFYPLLRDKVGY